MTDTVTTTTPNRSHRLYQVLAITGIAVGIFVIAAGLYLLIAKPGCCDSMNMSNMKMMEQRMDTPSMPSMSPTPNMPVPTPTR